MTDVLRIAHPQNCHPYGNSRVGICEVITNTNIKILCLSKYQNIMLKAKSRLPLQHCQPHHHHHHSAECVVRTIIGFTAFRSQFSCPAVQLCRQQFVLSFYREGQANAINDSLDPDFMNTKVI